LFNNGLNNRELKKDFFSLFMWFDYLAEDLSGKSQVYLKN